MAISKVFTAVLQRRFGRETWLVAFAIIPFAASLGFNAVEWTAQATQPTADRPALVFDQYYVNLGPVHNSARAEAHFCFKNCGKFPARITRLEPSCGCINPRLEKRAYAPGEICPFSMGVLTTRESPGKHDYELKIDYEDPAPRSVTIAFECNLSKREVSVNPSQLLFYQNGNAETEQTIVVSDVREKPLKITGAACKSPLVKVKVGQPVDKSSGGRETSISITVAAKVPDGRGDTWVMLTTDDSHFSRIPIPLMIRAMNSATSQSASAAPNGGTGVKAH